GRRPRSAPPRSPGSRSGSGASRTSPRRAPAGRATSRSAKSTGLRGARLSRGRGCEHRRVSALAALLAALAGLAGSVQAAVMGRLGTRVGTLEALAFSSLLQALLTGLLVVALRPGFGGYTAAARQPAWLWLGGVMGGL